MNKSRKENLVEKHYAIEILLSEIGVVIKNKNKNGRSIMHARFERVKNFKIVGKCVCPYSQTPAKNLISIRGHGMTEI